MGSDSISLQLFAILRLTVSYERGLLDKPRGEKDYRLLSVADIDKIANLPRYLDFLKILLFKWFENDDQNILSEPCFHS